MIGELQRDGTNLARGMHVLVTGSGSALVDADRGGASAVVLVDGHVLQFDCGRLVMENLVRAGINPLDVDALFLTHLHFDHIASFGYFAYASWVAGRQAILPVRGPSGTERMARAMIHEAHHADLAFVRGLVGTWPDDIPLRPRADPPYDVRDMLPGPIAETDAYRVSAIEVPHFQKFGMQSLAYRVDSDHGAVVITGDCHPTDALAAFASGADILVNECAKPDADLAPKGGKLNRSTTLDAAKAEPTHPHTTPTWLGDSAARAGVRTVIATHLAPLLALPASREMSRLYYGAEPTRPDIFEMYRQRIGARFAGRIEIARDGLVVSV